MALSEQEKIDWLASDNHRIVLMDLHYHNGTSLDTARFSSYPYVMDYTDSWNGFTHLLYDDIISNVPNIITKIDSDSTVGAIELLNVDGEYDNLLYDYTLVGHPIQLYIGQYDWPRDDFIIILDGIINNVSSPTPQTISIGLRDKKESLNVALQQELYIRNAGGTGYWDVLMDDAETNNNFIGELYGSQEGYNRNVAVLPPAVENTHVPICLGKCFNVEPVLVDSFNHVYQVHDGPIVDVMQVRSNGVILADSNPSSIRTMQVVDYWGGSGGAFIVGETIQANTNPDITGYITGMTGTNGVDYTLYYVDTSLAPDEFDASAGRFQGLTSGVRADAVNYGTTTAPGQYEVDLDLGLIRLLDHDQGTQITCDVEGQDGASALRSGTAPALVEHSAAYLIEWLLLEKASVDPTDICYETFAPTGSRPFGNTDELGFYSKSENTVLDACTRIINSVGGFMRFKSALCKLQIVRLEDPAGATADLTLIPDDIIEDGISISAIEEPKRSITLGYAKNWKTQDEGSLAGSIVDPTSPNYDIEILNSYMSEYSTVYEETGISSLEYPLAEDIELIETTIWDPTDAGNELARRIVLRGQRRRVLRINGIASSFTYDIGDIVDVTHPRFGLGGGDTAIIIGIEESPTSKRVNLDVWL